MGYFQLKSTIISNHSYDIQDNLYEFNPTVHHHVHLEEMFDMADKFINSTPDKPQIFYIWGHSYEFDVSDNWDRFEEFCKMMAGHDDIFYGTNKEVLL